MTTPARCEHDAPAWACRVCADSMLRSAAAWRDAADWPWLPPETDDEPSCCEYACYEDPGCTCDGCNGQRSVDERGLWVGCVLLLIAFAAGVAVALVLLATRR